MPRYDGATKEEATMAKAATQPTTKRKAASRRELTPVSAEEVLQLADEAKRLREGARFLAACVRQLRNTADAAFVAAVKDY